MRKQEIFAGVGIVVAIVLAVGLWAFEPWRLWTSSTVDEAIPGAEQLGDGSIRDVAETRGPETSTASPSDVPTPTYPPYEPSEPGSTSVPPEPEKQDQPEEPRLVIIGEGEFETAEHSTSGTAFLVEAADGSRFVRIEGLATSDGPDLHVGLSDAPSGGSWGSYDDGRYEDLGELKATHGNQNYDIPVDVDLDGLTTVVIWCDRFNVAFGTAPVA